MTTLGSIRIDRGRTIDPAQHRDETFDLYSIPAFPLRQPESVIGAAIGSTKQTVDPGTVLVSKINPRINRVWVVAEVAAHRQIASTEWIPFFSITGIDPRFLALYLQREEFRTYLATNVSGVGGSLMRVRPAVIDCLEIPIAPLNEQRRIVGALETHFTRLDAAVATLERVRANLKRCRAAVLQAAFSPQPEWATVSGRDVFEFITSGSRGWAKYYADSGPWFIRIGNLVRGDIQLDRTNMQHVSPPNGAEGTRTRVLPRDVLFSITAEIGLVGLVPDGVEEAYVNQHVALARPVASADARFVAWYFASPRGQRELRERMRGATKVGLGLDDIRDARLPQPPMGTQTEVVDHVEDALSVLHRMNSEIEMQVARCIRLRQSLLRLAFEGRLVPQDPRDEPASVLLDRIRVERAAAGSIPKKKSARSRR